MSISDEQSTNNNDDEGLQFTCKECGCNELVVKEYYTIVQLLTETQECSCGEGEGGLAYDRSYELRTSMVDYFQLEEDHHFTHRIEQKNLDDPQMSDDQEENIYCENCFDPIEECDVFEKDPENESEVDEQFFVVCGDCKREVEFGWSHPDRGGRIWPVESADFNPYKSWPEPRYRENWRKKKWLRPTD